MFALWSREPASAPLPRGSRQFESRRSLNVPVRCLLALFLPFCLYFFILQGDGKTRAKFWSTVEDPFVSFSPSFLFFFLHKLLNRFLPSAVSSHYPPTLLPRLLHHSLLLSAAAAASLTPLPSFARSQERRYLLCPLCRSLARCQTGPMPIKSHE